MSRFPRAVEALGALAAVVAAVAVWALTRTYPNYDSYYHLVWGRELVDGVTPSFEAYAAPTQHPLYVALCALLGVVLGEGADRALVLVCLLSHAALVFGTYRLGGVVFGRWSGLLAALFAAASASFLLYAERGYVDAPFLAVVVWAGVAAAEERPLRAMALVAVAGLLRPEAWVLAGLGWLWWVRRGTWPARLALTAAVVLPPALWAFTDWLVTGDPLHSISATTELADDLGRTRGLEHVPGSFLSFVGATVRPPVALLAAVGLLFALRIPGVRAARVPLALVAAGVLTFVGTGALGLSILPRYLTVPSAALCLFAGYALVGWTRLGADHPWRPRWRAGSAVAAVVGVGGLIVLAPTIDNVRAEVRFIAATHRDLVGTLDDPAVRTRMARCGPLSFPTYRLVPDARWHRDATRSAIRARSDRTLSATSGVAVFVSGEKALRRYGLNAGTNRAVNDPLPGFARIARHGFLTATARCP